LKRHLEISKIYSSFMFACTIILKNRYYTGLSRAYLNVVFVCIFVTRNIVHIINRTFKRLREDMDWCSRVKTISRSFAALTREILFLPLGTRTYIKSISLRNRLISSIYMCMNTSIWWMNYFTYRVSKKRYGNSTGCRASSTLLNK
jgi:hypothetical protein